VSSNSETEDSGSGRSPGVENEERAEDVAARLEGEEYYSRDELEDDLNGDSDVADLAFVELHNLNDLERFEDVEGGVAVFLPHCLREAEECMAERTQEGYDCKLCMACEVGEIKAALDGEADVYMVPGGGIIRKILRDKDYGAIVGVACFPELELGKKLTTKMDVASQMVALDDDGCQDTSVDVDSVLEKVD